jgi:ATP-binding protein involved in chromosome partitioning
MAVSKAQVEDKLRRIKGPDLTSNIVELGLVSEILIRDDKIYFSITVPAHRAEELEPLRQAAERVVRDIDGVAGATVVLTAQASGGGQGPRPAAARGGASPEHARVQAARERGAAGDGGHSAPRTVPVAAPSGRQQAQTVPGVKHLIAVASGKGGVGKSTTAVNLALGFQALGLKAGIMDADIYGPSQPRLLGLKGRPEVASGKTLKPMRAYGLEAMSMGFMVDEGTPIVWRGPMVVQALNQMLREVAWGDLDVLVIDMPPGTGDVQLTMAQTVPLSGAVIVSTPQDLALIDAKKSLAMFQKVNVPILGIVENMSQFICPKCGERSDIFGHGGAAREAASLGVPFLGAVPLHMDIRAKSDSGEPVTATEPDGPHAAVFKELAAKTWEQVLAAKGEATAGKPIDLEVSKTGDRLTVVPAKGDPYEMTAEMLRVMSPSAEVQGHSAEQRVTVGGKKAVKIRELRPVGNYAVRIVFDDGHDTGLFTWPYLAELYRDRERRWAEYLAELTAKHLSRE